MDKGNRKHKTNHVRKISKGKVKNHNVLRISKGVGIKIIKCQLIHLLSIRGMLLKMF
jgi:hypothetical protein